MSESDTDLPDLVDSSDDEASTVGKQRKQTEEHAECWLKRTDKFLEKQDTWNRIFCLCPFLFGINNILPAAWMKALMLAELILNNERQYNLTYIPWKEWECIDLMDLIIRVVQKKMRNKDTLSCVLDVVKSLDDCKTGVIIDVDLAIKEAGKSNEICDIWRDVLRDDLSQGKEKAAKFGVLYCIRLYLLHVLNITEGRGDFVDETRRNLRQTGAAKKAEEYKKEGNLVYARGNYRQSVEKYTLAAETDRLNHIYFGNRAQAYNKLKHYNEALADGRRAVTIKPDFSKGHYRYAQAFYYLGQLDAAIRVNKDGLSLCQSSLSKDYANIKELEQQGKIFTHERDDNKLKKHLTPIPKNLEEKLNEIPNTNCLEDLSEKWGFKVEKFERFQPHHLNYFTDDDIPPPMVSSDSDSDSPTPMQKERDNRPAPQKSPLKLDIHVLDFSIRTDANSDNSANANANNSANANANNSADANANNSANANANNSADANANNSANANANNSANATANNSANANANNSANANANDASANANNNARRRHRTAQEGVTPTLSATPQLSEEALQETKRAKERQDKQELQMYMLEGSDALLADTAKIDMTSYHNMSKVAMASYHKALDIVSHGDMEGLGLDESDLVTLKYAFGIAAIMTGIFKSILEGIETFDNIIKTHQDVRFPLAYFGLGKAYISLNRYSDAVSPLDDGYTITRNVRFATVPWPGSKTIIHESQKIILLECFQEAIELCKFPPLPDAVCQYHSDDSEYRTVIYLTDPDFKGVIKIICQMNCVIAFHQTCWRNYKADHNKVNDKDILDTPCPTPDCGGLIMQINIMRPDSLTKKHESEKQNAPKVTKPKRPLLKLKTTSEEKLARKREKKELRKQRRRENREEKDDLMDDINDMLHASSDNVKLDHEGDREGMFESQNLHPLPDIKDTTVLKKDDLKYPKLQISKTRKLKKKKDKTRQVINLPLNFADRQEESMIGDGVAVIEDDKTQTPTTKAAKSPSPKKTKPDLNKVEKTVNRHGKMKFPTDEITENLFSYFDDLLKASGPINIDDPKIQQEIEVFPLEAQEKIKQVGGLGDFLRQSLKFAVIDDVISLMSEAVKAREMAMLLRNGRKQVDTLDSWKTVGKAHVDSFGVNFPEISPKSSENLSNKQQTDFLYSRNPDSVGGGDNAMVGKTKHVVNSNTNAETTSVPNVTPVNMSDKPSVGTQGTRVEQDTFDKFFSSANTIELESPNMDTLNSIDDFSSLNKNGRNKAKHLDDIDEFEIVSDPGSEFFNDHKENVRTVNMNPDLRPKPLYEPSASKFENSVSMSSSESDMSEKSSVSSEPAPQPLKPLKGVGVGPQTQVWEKADSEDVWAQVKKADFEGSERSTDSPRSGVDSVGLEIRKAAEEFVYKTDEKFVSELANSVVERIFQEKNVSESEKLETLKRVSADIWKDFKRSAAAGKLGSSGLLDGNRGGVDYSKTVGTFASDFMKRYYLKEDGVPLPPSSNISVMSPSSVNSELSHISPVNGVVSQNSPGNGSSPWTADAVTNTGATFNTNKSNIHQGPGMTSGYNLFSGPSYGFDSVGYPTLPNSQVPPPNFVRPPLAATSYYTTGGVMLPNSPSGLHFRPPPMLRMPFSPRSPVPVTKMDKETQVLTEYKSVEIMTDPYHPHQEELLQLKLERDEYMKIHKEGKAYCEKLIRDFMEKENQWKHREGELSSLHRDLDQERRGWTTERDSLQDQIRHIKQEVAARDSKEIELKDTIVAQGVKVNEIAKLATEQRDKDLSEIKRFMAAAERYRRGQEQSQQRARVAEVEILNSREQAAVHRLERAIKEATYHSQHLDGFIKKHEEKSVPPAFKQTLDHWKLVVEKCGQALLQLKAEYENQRTEISNGKKLSDLDPIQVPSAPPMPEAIKQLMGNAAMMGKLVAHNSHAGAVSPTIPQMPLALPSPTTHPRRTPSPTSQMPQPAFGPFTTTGNSTGHFSPPTDVASTVTPPSNTIAMPKPLILPSGGSWSVAPPPLTQLKGAFMGPRPLLMPPRLNVPGSKQPMTSFEKLMLKLQTLFPNYESSHFKKHIQELRQGRGGSLSGMTIEDITNQIAEIIHNREKQKASVTAAAQGKKQMAAPPGLNTSWAFTPDKKKVAGAGVGAGTRAGEDYFQEEEDPCVICHEEMAGGVTTTLECGHKFHDECIRKWFKEQSTCPNCRVHALLSDDFPTLG